MKTSGMIILSDSDFSHRIMKKYQKGKRSPPGFPLMIFLDKMQNFLSQGMNMDVLLRFYLTRQYPKFSIFLDKLQTIKKLLCFISIPKQASSQISYYGNNLEFFDHAARDNVVFLNELLHPTNFWHAH